MIARVTTGLWFLFVGLQALCGLSVGSVGMAILALIAGIAILCGI